MKRSASVGCALAAWLALAGAAAMPAMAADEPGGVAVERNSWLTNLVPAEAVERAAVQQYGQLKQQAAARGVLVPANDARVLRLRTIAQRILPYVRKWNPRAKDWQWEVNLIESKDVNAFCMPGGKIVFFTGILEQLKLTDDEVAAVMGHEIAHALREHARERIAKTQATQVGVGALSQILGLGDLGRLGLNVGGQLLTLKFSRDDESEADVVGLDVAARAGYDPRAGVALWEKMAKLSKGGMPDWLSTHPSGPNRIAEMQRRMPDVLPLYARARGTTVERLPAYRSNM